MKRILVSKLVIMAAVLVVVALGGGWKALAYNELNSESPPWQTIQLTDAVLIVNQSR